jgi:fermentation-respiration switch protein FrsA (DUF1100 family)
MGLIAPLAIMLLVAVAIAAIGAATSMRFTRRPEPDPKQDPADMGLNYERAAFTTRDGLLLRGWYFPAGVGDRGVVFLHGHGGSMDPDVKYVPPFQNAGISVLMFDFRAHGRSEGKTVSMGYLERYDALAAAEYLRGRGVQRLGLLGFSMGGVVAILSAPHLDAVRAVVVDGVFGSLMEPIIGWGRLRGIPIGLSRVLGALTIGVTCARLGVNLFKYQPSRQVGKLDTPIFFIHGAQDEFVRMDHFQGLVRAAPEPKQAWIVEGARHREADQLHPEEYRRRVLQFFQEHL